MNAALGNMVGYHLRRASVQDMAGAVAVLRPAGARPITVSVLLCIVETPGITSAQICRVLGMQRANIVQFLADLEARNLFIREADPQDQRVHRLFATKEGEEAARDWLDRLRLHEDRMLRNLSADERAELRRLLELVWSEDDED
ncbi:MarR family winged helix-turn-helix transcriptional regulator [Falsirhodobacter deserti]|uniref:MarR family winged helix-turn-helix transcriptional regulator n=1 Tax=Falsirhodobacter deserti TaxID=1365611 RepID=UPI0030C8A1BD